MTNFVEILTHGRRLKAAVKELTIDELKAVADKLNKIIEDKELQAEAETAKQAERKAKIDAICQQMAESGISAEELSAISVKPTVKKRAKRPAKYQIEIDGKLIQWTGQGRTPLVFKSELDKGRTMDEFLISAKA